MHGTKQASQAAVACAVAPCGQGAECLELGSPAVPDKLALVMGKEAGGVSDEMLQAADK